MSNIPSVNSVIKKINENKKLNFIENILNERLNYYLSNDKNIYAVKKDLSNELVKYNFNREMLRKILEESKIKDIKFSDKININGKKYDTIITLKNMANKDNFNNIDR